MIRDAVFIKEVLVNNDIMFMPLGGGQRVGASCYYLRLGNSNIILDAGTGILNGVQCNPVFSQLTLLPSMHSLNQINQIYVSHAHIDHTGYLIDMISQSPNSSVYMTEITKALSELQIYDRIYLNSDRKSSEEKRLKAQGNLDKISIVSYIKPIIFPEYKVNFFPAGHIPGAMMTLFEFKKRKILYTGDFSIDSSPLCSPCMIPKDERIDTVIMCGLHAKHPYYRKKTDNIYEQAEYVFNTVIKKRKTIQCSVTQLSKGIEFLKLLNEMNINHIPVFLDQNTMQVVRKLEKLGIKIMTQDNKQMLSTPPSYPHVYITSQSKSNSCYYSEKIDVDFTLHEDFSQMRKFIETVNPKQVILVHCATAYDENEYTIEQEMLINSDCQTQFIFAEEQEIYKL